MKTLVIRAVEVVQFLWIQQAKILVSPCQVADVRSQMIHLLLQMCIVFISTICRHFLQKFNALDKLVTMLSCFVYSLFNCEFFRVLWGTSNPPASFFFAKQPKFECATTCNAAKRW